MRIYNNRLLQSSTHPRGFFSNSTLSNETNQSNILNKFIIFYIEVKKYGKLLVNIVKKLKKHKIMKDLIITNTIYFKLVNFYFSLRNNQDVRKFFLKIKTNDEAYTCRCLSKFIRCFPKIEMLDEMVETLNTEREKYKNEVFLIKIILDLYLDYYKNTDNPLNKVSVNH